MTEPSPRCRFCHQPIRVYRGQYEHRDFGAYAKCGHGAEPDQPSVSGGAPPTERCEGMGGSCELPKGHQFACACNIPPENRWGAGQAATPAPPQDATPLLATQLSREYNFSTQEDRVQAMRMGAELYAAGKSDARAASERAPERRYLEDIIDGLMQIENDIPCPICRPSLDFRHEESCTVLAAERYLSRNPSRPASQPTEESE